MTSAATSGRARGGGFWFTARRISPQLGGMFKEVDHIAIVVRDTGDALKFYRDQMGLPELYSEILDEVGVRLTHLDMGNLRLQLVQPLRPDHPLSKHLDEHGEGLHHVCWKVDEIGSAMTGLAEYGLKPKPNEPHPAPNGGKAAFIEPSQTRGVLWEMTAPKIEKP